MTSTARNPLRTTRNKPFRTSVREKDMIVSLFLDGYRPSEIAKNLGRAYLTIATVITDAGYTPERYSYTEKEVALWAAMYDGNDQHELHCVREIAELSECPPSRVHAALLRHGVRMRHPARAIRIAAEKRRRSKQ